MAFNQSRETFYKVTLKDNSLTTTNTHLQDTSRFLTIRLFISLITGEQEMSMPQTNWSRYSSTVVYLTSGYNSEASAPHDGSMSKLVMSPLKKAEWLIDRRILIGIGDSAKIKKWIKNQIKITTNMVSSLASWFIEENFNDLGCPSEVSLQEHRFFRGFCQSFSPTGQQAHWKSKCS